MGGLVSQAAAVQQILDVVSGAQGFELDPSVRDEAANEIAQILSKESETRLRALRLAQVHFAKQLTVRDCTLTQGIEIQTQLASTLKSLVGDAHIREFIDETERRRIAGLLSEHQQTLDAIQRMGDELVKQNKKRIAFGMSESGRIVDFALDLIASIIGLLLAAGLTLIFGHYVAGLLGAYATPATVVVGLCISTLLFWVITTWLDTRNVDQPVLSEDEIQEIAKKALGNAH